MSIQFTINGHEFTFNYNDNFTTCRVTSIINLVPYASEYFAMDVKNLPPINDLKLYFEAIDTISLKIINSREYIFEYILVLPKYLFSISNNRIILRASDYLPKNVHNHLRKLWLNNRIAILNSYVDEVNDSIAHMYDCYLRVKDNYKYLNLSDEDTYNYISSEWMKIHTKDLDDYTKLIERYTVELSTL